MNGIIYTRVSSQEQVNGTSLERQEEMCREYCERSGINILAVFKEEGESAKSLALNNRREFLAALAFCKKHKGGVHAFVVLRVDRFARNTEDHFAVRRTLLQSGTRLHSATEPIGEGPAEKFIETVLAGASDYDNAVRRQRCTDGMVARIEQGLLPWKAPAGYTSLGSRLRGEKKTHPDSPNPRTFPIIQRALRDYARGRVVSQLALMRLLNDRGYEAASGRKANRQIVDRMTNAFLPFYAGWVVNPWTRKAHKGQHVPMLSEDDVRDICDRRNGRARRIIRVRRNPSFPLRRRVSCGLCRTSLAGATSRGNGGRYDYYYCRNAACSAANKTIRAGDLDGAFAKLLRRLHPNPKSWPVLLAHMKDVVQHRSAVRAQSVKAVDRRSSVLAAKRARIFEMLENGEYNHSQFKERLAVIDGELAQLERIRTADETQLIDVERALLGIRQLAHVLDEALAGNVEKLFERFDKFLFRDSLFYDRTNGFANHEIPRILALKPETMSKSARDVNLADDTANQIDKNVVPHGAQILAEIELLCELVEEQKEKEREAKLAA